MRIYGKVLSSHKHIKQIYALPLYSLVWGEENNNYI